MLSSAKKKLLIKAGIIILAVFAVAITAENDVSVAGKSARVKNVKVISFTTASGQIIRGKVLSEDRNFVTIEYPSQSSIGVQTVARKEMIPDSFVQQTISEYEYWMQLADYFKSQTWDFKNDPDDFMQAIRCLEKARDITAEIRGKDHVLVVEIQAGIDKLNLDSQSWVEKAKIRAEQMNLETMATLDETIKKLTDISAANSEQIAKLERISSDTARVQTDIENLKSQIQQELSVISANIKSMSDDIVKNTARTDELWRQRNEWYRYLPASRIIPDKEN